MINHSTFRSQRTIRYFGQNNFTEVSVIVGLFNAEIYLDGLFQQIIAQTKNDVIWVFLDNNSEDNTYKLVENWLTTAGLNAVLVKNPINLGATGSTYTNLDLIKSKWVTFFHQDDYYSPNFISTLWDSLNKSKDNPILVYGDMGRVNESGKKIGAFPPASWMLPDSRQTTYFLSLIRNHCVPWPAVMVQTSELMSVEPPWHSAAFPDTELTLRLAAHGTFLHVAKEVMAYRDNLGSESRSLLNDEREFGSALGLTRVFSSREFIEILDLVKESERKDFIEKLLSSIQVRFSNTLLCELISAHALERINEHWNYSEGIVLNQLSAIYSSVGGSRTVEQLDRLSNYAGFPVSGKSLVKKIKIASSTSAKGNKTNAKVVAIYTKFGGFVPFRLKKILFPYLLRSISKNNQLSAWNYDWNSR